MKLTSSTKWTIAIVLIQITTLVFELIFSTHKVISNTFIVFGCLFLLVILIQWISFKMLNSKIRTNRLRETTLDRRNVESLIDRKNDGELTNNEIITARRLRGWLIIYTIIIPLIVSIVIGITFAFV